MPAGKSCKWLFLRRPTCTLSKRLPIICGIPDAIGSGVFGGYFNVTGFRSCGEIAVRFLLQVNNSQP